MIGNVFELTSSKAAYYPGGSLTTTSSMQNSVVIRGGSYRDKAAGASAITATYRDWIDKTKKHPTLGFRLVREAP
jgi:formylglycine-generating enzyme required for sulfatase activity